MTKPKEARCKSALARAEAQLKRGQSQESIARGVTFTTWQKNKQKEVSTLKSKLGLS